jgi:hypothetical protein
MRRIACAAVFIAALLSRGTWLLAGQQSVMGTASIAGTTTDAGGRPLPRTVVRLSGSVLKLDLLTVSNDDGRFEFTDLPPGRFALTASKPTYLETSLGSLSPAAESNALVLEAGERRTDLRLALAPGGVISGRVTDRYGRALSNAPIVAMQFRTANGERTLWSLGQQTPPTNSRGEYRIYGLAAGSYLVMAYEPGDYLWFSGRTPGPVSQPGGAMSYTDVRPTTAADVQWALQRLNQPSAPGLATAGPPPPPRGPGVSQGATYYPGTVDAERAVLVSVRAGEESAGIDFSAHGLPTARITGRVVGPDGRPATSVRLAVRGGGSTSSRPLSDDGSFVLLGVTPGDLTLTATVPDSSLSATRTLVVAGQDITDVVLTLQPLP